MLFDRRGYAPEKVNIARGGGTCDHGTMNYVDHVSEARVVRTRYNNG